MSNIIKLLPDQLANQIAAGEVIQRPASVVKELLENSIDSGANHIELILKDSGKNLIKVVDNGSGMNPEDARLAFERHATSKINSSDDLFKIKTMGFRGEALPSIAAVSRMEMTTQLASEEMGTQILIEGSELVSQEPHATLAGTSISVKNLFFNVPARRKFLKSDKVELRRIIQEFERIALGFPNLSFSLYNDNQELMRLPVGTQKERIITLFGKKLTDRLFPIKEETDLVKLSGFGVKPEHCKKSREEQFFFLNKRYFKSGYLHHAVKGAYEGLLGPGEHPSYFIFLEMNPNLVDVNVHPTKQEIKFQDERAIYNIIRVTVRHGLGKNQLTPTIDFESERGAMDLSASPRPFPDYHSGGGFSSPKKGDSQSADNWNQIFEGVRKEMTESDNPKQLNISGDKESESIGKFFQIHNRYVAVQSSIGLAIIDQQRAHEQILYREFLHFLESEGGSSQSLIFPHTVELAASDVPLLKEILPRLQKTGLQVEHFGGNSFVIHGTPSVWSRTVDPEVLLGDILEYYRTSGDIKDFEKRLAKSMSLSLRFPAAKKLSESEMEILIDRVFNQIPDTDMTHKSAVVWLDDESLNKLFTKK